MNKRILFLDIDGYAVNADIQGYVSQIELFGDEPIKDFEYIKNCIQFMLNKAKESGTSSDEINFIERVYKYVSINMFEMLKEARDCFLEYDNLDSDEAKKKYIEDYQKNPIAYSNSEEVPMYMEYINKALKYAKSLISSEYARVKLEGGKLNLPFKTINKDNDIIHYTGNEDPLERAESAIERMEIYSINTEKGIDQFLAAVMMVGYRPIVDYNDIYTKENLKPGLVESLEYLLKTKQVDMIVACSHYTGPREAKAKFKLFAEELPFVVMIPQSLLKFHTEPAQMGKRRERSSKNDRIDEMIQIIAQRNGIETNQIEVMLGDDSKPNHDGLSEDKVGILFRKLSTEESEKGFEEQLSGYPRQTCWGIGEMDRLMPIVRQAFEQKQAGANNIENQKVMTLK